MADFNKFDKYIVKGQHKTKNDLSKFDKYKVTEPTGETQPFTPNKLVEPIEPIELKLPGYKEVEKRIPERQKDASWKRLEEEVMQPWELPKLKTLKESPLKFLKEAGSLAMRPLVTGLKTLAVPFEREEAAISNAFMKIQEGRKDAYMDLEDYNKLSFMDRRKQDVNEFNASIDFMSEIGKDTWKGLTGERLGQFGDIFRRVGVDEFSSATLGLFSFGAMLNLTTSGNIFGKVKEVSKHLPQAMDKNYTYDRAVKAVDLLDDTRGKLGQNVGKFVEKYSDDVINADTLSNSEAIQKMTPLLKNITDDVMYAIEKLPDGSVKPTVGNMYKLRKALSDFMSSKAWEEATKTKQSLIKQVYGDITKEILRVAPDLEPHFTAYANFMKAYAPIASKLKTKGTIVEKPLRGMFKKGSERAYRRAWDKLSESVPQLNQVAKDMTKYIQRETLKRFTGRAAPWIVGGALAGAGYKGMRGTLESGFGGDYQ